MISLKVTEIKELKNSETLNFVDYAKSPVPSFTQFQCAAS